MMFAMLPVIVRFPASVEAIASASHALCEFEKFGTSDFRSITAGTSLTILLRNDTATVIAPACADSNALRFSETHRVKCRCKASGRYFPPALVSFAAHCFRHQKNSDGSKSRKSPTHIREDGRCAEIVERLACFVVADTREREETYPLKNNRLTSPIKNYRPSASRLGADSQDSASSPVSKILMLGASLFAIWYMRTTP